jgi:hypothetical protein
MIDEIIDKEMAKASTKPQNKVEVLKDNNVVTKLWNHYKNFYRKQYQTDDEEKGRLGKFLHNLKHIVKENVRFESRLKSFKLHLNRFADMDLAEFRKKMTGLKTNNAIYVKSFSMQREKRFLFDSVKKEIKKVKNKINKKLHPGKNRTTDTVTSKSKSTLDYRPYMNPIENQGQCG